MMDVAVARPVDWLLIFEKVVNGPIAVGVAVILPVEVIDKLAWAQLESNASSVKVADVTLAPLSPLATKQLVQSTNDV